MRHNLAELETALASGHDIAISDFAVGASFGAGSPTGDSGKTLICR
jgi:hypothetical protein